MEKRLLVVSDIHGHYRPFMKLLELVNYRSEQDTLIVLGDLIDRGPQASAVVDWFLPGHPGEKAIVIRGNHEEGFLQFLKGDMAETAYLNLYMGGIKTVESYKSLSVEEMEKHIRFLQGLPYYHRQDGFIFVHAGMKTHKALEFHTEEDFLCVERRFFTQEHHPKYPNDIVVFGHTPTGIIREIVREKKTGSYIWYDCKHKNKIGIDCGNHKKKRLACLDLTNCIEYYQPISRTERVEIRTTEEALR